MSTRKLLWGVVIGFSVLLLISMLVFIYMWFALWKMDLTTDMSQVENEQTVKVKWDTTKDAEQITIKVKHDGDLLYSVTLQDTNALLKGEYSVPAYYGKHEITVIAKRGAYRATNKKEVKVFADEYNIAPVTGTMPVTLFTLGLEEITNDYKIPTFVWFKRNLVWNYSQMPNNVYTIPVATNLQINSKTEVDQKIIYEETNKWIKELYEINPNSKFNLYYNDFYSYAWLQTTLGGGIPLENCNITLLSDGVGSFSIFNKYFDNETAKQTYAEMKATYNKLKEEIISRNTYSEYDKGFIVRPWDAKEYTYVMVNEESNITWWLTRISGTMANNNTEMFNELKNNKKVKVKDLNTMFNLLNSVEQRELTKLFNFSDNIFEKAVKENKEVMLFLGTWDEDEVGFDNYVKTIQAYYGDNYVYYYKGHPRTPTSNIEGKFDKLEKLNLIDVDSTIPAELLSFFNPEIFASGYQSSTFLSLSDEKSCAITHVKKDNFTQGYKNNIDIFITEVTSSDSVYGELVSGNCCLIEFNNTENYDFAIYNVDQNKFDYYKNNNGNFVKV